MVSNVLGLEPAELLARLEQLHAQLASDPAYQELRRQLPDDWPI